MSALASVEAPVHQLLTRFAKQAQRAGVGQYALKLDSKSFPAVFQANTGEDADYFWDMLKAAAAASSVGIRLAPSKALCAEYERRPKLELSRENVPKLLIALGMAPLGPSVYEVWQEALRSDLDAPPSVVEALSGFSIKVEGKTAQDVVQALNHLRRLKDEPLLLREASSRVFWGLSKVLDNRSEMVAVLLEVAECPFPAAPLLVNIRLPASPLRGVLFVENLTTFGVLGRLDAPPLDGLALVYSAGFLASARRLTVRTQVACSYLGDNPHPGSAQGVERFLFDKEPVPSYFFGDLDYSGMAILKALRQNFSSLQAWEPGYSKLLSRLEAGEGHSPVSAGKAGQRDPTSTGCRMADELLLPAMRKAGLFVDQE